MADQRVKLDSGRGRADQELRARAYHGQVALLGLSVYLALALILGALLAFPAYVVLADAGPVAFDSVLRRTILLTGLLLLPLYLASTNSRDRNALGFACSPQTFARGFLTGFSLGVAAVTPLLAALLLLGIRTPTLPAMPSEVAVYAASALLAAAIVGVFEEAYFRGALLGALRPLPAWVAVSLVSLVYAGAHFIGGPIAADETRWYSGLSSIGRSELQPDAFLALVAAGLLLGAMRCRFGHVALGAGFHSGWVWLMQVNREYSDVNSSSQLLFLEGSFGGTMGYLGLAWIALLGAIWFIWAKRVGAKAS
jgi:uncharacterized protein